MTTTPTEAPNHTISLLVHNKPGVLLRICLVFSRRGFNIESLVVSPAIDGRFSRMTITAEGSKHTLEQIIKQTEKLIDVLHATEHTDESVIQKEMALIKVKATEKDQTSILQVVDHFKGQTLDFSEDSLIIQITGTTEKCDACIDLLNKYTILEVVRTGKVLMARGAEET